MFSNHNNKNSICSTCVQLHLHNKMMVYHVLQTRVKHLTCCFWAWPICPIINCTKSTSQPKADLHQHYRASYNHFLLSGRRFKPQEKPCATSMYAMLLSKLCVYVMTYQHLSARHQFMLQNERLMYHTVCYLAISQSCLSWHNIKST